MRGTSTGREIGVIAVGGLVIMLIIVGAVGYLEKRERYASTLAVCHALKKAVRDYHLRYSVHPVGMRKQGFDATVASDANLTNALLGFRSRGYDEFAQITKEAGGHDYRLSGDKDWMNDLIGPAEARLLGWESLASGNVAGLVSSGQLGSHALVDAWGNHLQVIVDGNNDNTLANPDATSTTKILKETIMVFSAGPDGDDKTWNDNIKSW